MILGNGSGIKWLESTNPGNRETGFKPLYFAWILPPQYVWQFSKKYLTYPAFHRPLFIKLLNP